MEQKYMSCWGNWRKELPYFLIMIITYGLTVTAAWILGGCLSEIGDRPDRSVLMLIGYTVLIILTGLGRKYQRASRVRHLSDLKKEKRQRLISSIYRKEIRELFSMGKGALVYLTYNELEEYCEDIWKFRELIFEIATVLISVSIGGGLLNPLFLPLFWLLLPACACISLKKADICIETHDARHNAGAAYQQILKEDIENFQEITCMGAKAKFFSRFRTMADRAMSAEVSHARAVRLYQFYEKGFEYLCYGAVFLMAVFLIDQGLLRIGFLVTLLSYTGSFYLELSQINYAKDLLMDIRAIEKDLKKIDEAAEVAFGSRERIPEDARTAVTMRNVIYSYNGKEKLSYNLEIIRGEIVALMGNSGRGKTTVFRLLTRLAQPLAGEILLFGYPIHEYTEETLHGSVVCMTQRPYLWEGTIRENLIPEDGCGEREIQTDLDFLGLKYNPETKLSADAAGLSGGERQRLTFLRSVYAEGELILLDEPTSNLDKAASETVYGSIRKYFSGKTVIIISHDERICDFVDRVIRLDENR